MFLLDYELLRIPQIYHICYLINITINNLSINKTV